MPDLSTIFLVYAALSLVIGGAAVTHEIWHEPAMLDRASGGKHPSPKMQGSELVLLGAFVAIFWPVIGVAVLVDALGARL